MNDADIITHVTPGARYTIVAISVTKWYLSKDIPAEFRLQFLEFLDRQTKDLFTPEAIAAVDPMPADGRELYKETTKLGRRWPDTVARRDVFDAFVAINPSILTALRMPRLNGFDPCAMRTF